MDAVHLAARQTNFETIAPSRSELEFRRLLDKLPAAAYTCDQEGLITYFNTRAVQLWGREPKRNDPQDRYCGSYKLFTPDGTPLEHSQCWMARALAENREYDNGEIVVERPDGTRLTVLAHANPLHDEDGKLTGGVNVLVDITDRKRAEDALRDADRRKDEFLAILAHELRNPLAPLRNALHILRLDGINRTTLEEARALMERQLRQLVRLVDDLMDVSRITRNKPVLRKETIELAQIVQSAIESTQPLIEAAGHHFQITLPQEPIFLHGDLTRLAQAFANLLNNAIKYTEPGGSIWLIGEREKDNTVAVTVRDTGMGIAAEMLPHIFDLFTQVDRTLERSQGGLGIGLHLVRGLIEMHGGTIEARSAGLGRGCEFIIRLPILTDIEPCTSKAPVVSEALPVCKRRILVVDDNKDAAISLSKMLRLNGHEVDIAHDGMQALEEAARFLPEVILLDIGLPKLNGYQVARKVREQPWGVSMFLVALTGWGQDEDKRRAAQAGFNLHMVKPVDPVVLQQLLAGLGLEPQP